MHLYVSGRHGDAALRLFGQVLPTDTIVERVWGYGGRGDQELVRGLISRLRAKVEADSQNPSYILTVPDVGYSFREPDE
jgi:DNA-binding response OmpR family regulator